MYNYLEQKYVNIYFLSIANLKMHPFGKANVPLGVHAIPLQPAR